MKRIKINVTKTDIKKGRQSDPNCCAIALACRRQLPAGISFRSVGNQRIGVERSDGTYLGLSLPIKAQRFIYRFDEKKSLVEPFSFTVGIGEPVEL